MIVTTQGKGALMFANDIFKALADPTRREILRILGVGEMTAGELANKFDMKKPSVSHHFSVLKGADLISSRREGQLIYYSLNTTVMQDLVSWMMEWMKVNETRNEVGEISKGSEEAGTRPATTEKESRS